MSESEFDEAARLYASGQLGRRRFIARLIAGGVTMSAAAVFADAAMATAAKPSTAALYGQPPGKGGTPPGQGGTPPPFQTPPPGLGGTPPGKGGTPPGQQKSKQNRI
jgi:hypothetical protein